MKKHSRYNQLQLVGTSRFKFLKLSRYQCFDDNNNTKFKTNQSNYKIINHHHQNKTERDCYKSNYRRKEIGNQIEKSNDKRFKVPLEGKRVIR